MKERIYLDHASTTPIASEVLESMLPYFTQQYGNASSRSHPYGWEAEQGVNDARDALADLLNVESSELTYTSGSTESINLAIKGIAQNYPPEKCHLITSSTEHAAVIDTHEALERLGYEVTYLEPDSNGILALEDLKQALQPHTRLVSVLWANNETGVIQDLKAFCKLCKSHGILLFADGTQLVGKIPCQPRQIGIDLLALSAHKFYGPKGVGALWHSKGNTKVALRPQIFGGGHEGGLRAGTLNVPGIIGLGACAKLAKAEMKTIAHKLEALRSLFEKELTSRLEQVLVNGAEANRLPHISNMSFRFIEAEALLSTFQRRVAVSTGSACSSADLEPSHVLLAMGLSKEDAKSSIRVSLGRDTSETDIHIAIELIEKGVQQLRAESPAWELFQDGIIL